MCRYSRFYTYVDQDTKYNQGVCIAIIEKYLLLVSLKDVNKKLHATNQCENQMSILNGGESTPICLETNWFSFSTQPVDSGDGFVEFTP